MKIIENVTIYKCDFCNKKMQRKHSMVSHEEFCTMNPKNKDACTACVFCEEIKIPYMFQWMTPHGESEEERTAKGFKCTKLEKVLYPHKVIKKGLLEKYPETFEGQELMPIECEHWNYTK